MKKKSLAAGLILAALAGIVAFLVLSPKPRTPEDGCPEAEAGTDGRIADAGGGEGRSLSSAPAETPAEEDAAETLAGEDEGEPPTPEEEAAAQAEAKVEAFDALTDRWQEPSKAGVTMKDVDGFVAAFRAVPADRRDECIHRALNLVPDENVMLLAGVLMDKSMDRETVETVFNDVLNRDEDVKKPILRQIFADRQHPCWADTAWILDVTGEIPGKQ